MSRPNRAHRILSDAETAEFLASAAGSEKAGDDLAAALLADNLSMTADEAWERRRRVAWFWTHADHLRRLVGRSEAKKAKEAKEHRRPKGVRKP